MVVSGVGGWRPLTGSLPRSSPACVRLKSCDKALQTEAGLGGWLTQEPEVLSLIPWTYTRRVWGLHV